MTPSRRVDPHPCPCICWCTRRSTRLHTLPMLALAALLMQTPRDGHAGEPGPRDLRAAHCVAALEVNTQELAQQVKSGNESLRPLMLQRLVSGTAFVGEVYLQGHVDEKEARALADQALEAQKRLTPQELEARQRDCDKEGSGLYEASNALQQAVVRHLARKRMDRLLAK